MRRTRRRNTFLKKIVLGFAVVALMAPAAAQARWQQVPTGVHGHPDNRGVGSYDIFVAGATDFPKPLAVPSDALKNDYVGGVTDFPKPVAAAAQVSGRGDLIESVRLNPRTTARDYDLIENRRADTPRISTPVTVASPGFDWGDAGVGAALALGLVLLAGAAVLTSRHVQKPQTA
jgi:hypothetical protein